MFFLHTSNRIKHPCNSQILIYIIPQQEPYFSISHSLFVDLRDRNVNVNDTQLGPSKSASGRIRMQMLRMLRHRNRSFPQQHQKAPQRSNALYRFIIVSEKRWPLIGYCNVNVLATFVTLMEQVNSLCENVSDNRNQLCDVLRISIAFICKLN